MTSFDTLGVGEFLDQAASDAPTPGGGAVAALAGALGAAMASMAANFTVGKPKFAQHDDLMRRTLAALAPLLQSLRRGMDADAEAFSGISLAYRLPRESEADKARRTEAIQAALTAAMRVPLTVLADCGRAADLLPALAETTNPNLLSDVEVAAIMLEAAARAARVNVLVNARQLRTEEARTAEREAENAVARIAELAARTAAAVARRGA